MGAMKTAAETADNSGPLEERLKSKNWSVRANAYDELNKVFADPACTGKEPAFSEYVGSWKDYLKDSNPGALEKALGCLENFLKKVQAKTLLDSQNGIITVIIEKMLLTHVKAGVKAKAMECFLLLFECTANFDDIIDTMSTLLKHKNVKVSASLQSCGHLYIQI